MVQIPETFEQEKKKNIAKQASDSSLHGLALDFVRESARYNYSYHFTWMGRPIIQFPQDIITVQEIIWNTRPDLIIETGIAHGGALVFYASMIELLGNDGHVVGIDIEIREHNRWAIDEHSMRKRISMIEGSSTDPAVVAQVYEMAKSKRRVMVLLDSNHTHDHVLRELEVYSPLVSKGSYLVVFDTAIEDVPETLFEGRPWGKGNNPKTAVLQFLKTTKRFVVDDDVSSKLLITVSPGGYLKCIED